VQVRENKYGTFWKHVDSFDAKMCAADKEEKISLLKERVSYLQSQYEIQQQMTHEAKMQVKELENELNEIRRNNVSNTGGANFVCSDTSGGIGISPPENKLRVYKKTLKQELLGMKVNTEKLHDNQFYFYRSWIAGKCEDWRIGQAFVEEGQTWLYTIGHESPMKMDDIAMNTYRFVEIERPD
jgi:hypothetical protein